MRIVVLSDTHGDLSKIPVPDGDLLLHAGDLTVGGSRAELEQVNEDFGRLPHKRKIAIAGNHDGYLQSHPLEGRALFTNVTYLQDEEVVVDGIKIYGTPWQPEFKQMAFNLKRNSDCLGYRWFSIPEDTDILLTHCPPYKILDRVVGEHCGCLLLDYRLQTMQRPPLLHCFGHIHSGYGMVRGEQTKFVNAACSGALRAPFVIDWDELKRELGRA
jgi:Icc-related predicted phosphoesterase